MIVMLSNCVRVCLQENKSFACKPEWENFTPAVSRTLLRTSLFSGRHVFSSISCCFSAWNLLRLDSFTICVYVFLFLFWVVFLHPFFYTFLFPSRHSEKCLKVRAEMWIDGKFGHLKYFYIFFLIFKLKMPNMQPLLKFNNGLLFSVFYPCKKEYWLDKTNNLKM